MIPTSYIEQDFVFGDNQVFREFDMSGFAVNASNVLRSNNEIIYDLNFDYYISMIRKALSHLAPLKIDPEKMLLIKKYGRDYRIDAEKTLVKELLDPETVILRPKYLEQMLDNIGLTIDRAHKGSISKEEINRYISSDMTNKVKRQMVRTNLPYEFNKKEIVNLGAPNMVPFTVKYISGYPTEFITNWESYKKDVCVDAANVINSIENVKTTFASYMVALDALKVEGQWNEENTRNLYYISFNAMRNLLEAVSFLSFMTIRKIGIIANNIVRSNEILNRLFIMYANPITEGVLDALVVKNDSKSLGEKLLAGEVDAFEELAGKLFDYHKSIYEGSPFDDGRLDIGRLQVSLDMRLDNTDYDTTPYDEVKDMYGVISQGLGMVSANCDDYLVVFDDILDKSGFVTELSDRFAGTINIIDDISEYESAVDISKGVSPEIYVYYRMMKEVRDYADNMEEIAKLVLDGQSTLNILIDRFDRNINTEYKNTLTVSEAKAFLSSLADQYSGLAISVAAKFMLRLKNIAVCLEKFDKDRSTELQNSGYQVESSTSEDGSTVLERSIFTSSYKTQEAITDFLFEAMMESFEVSKTRKEMGINIVITESKVSDLATKIKAVLIRWYEKVSEKLKGLMRGPRAAADQSFIDTNLNKLLSGSFANKQSPMAIIEYEKLAPASNMMEDVKSLVKKTSSVNLKAEKLASITDEESASSVIFGSRPPASVWKDGNPAKNIARFYKCGEYPENPVEVKNNDLKQMVVDAGKFCKDFYGKFLPTLNENINLIKDNITNNMENIIKESSIETIIGQMFMEADDSEEYKGMDASKGDSGKDSGSSDSSSSTDNSSNDSSDSSSSSNSSDSSGSTSTPAPEGSSSSSTPSSDSSSSTSTPSTSSQAAAAPSENAKAIAETAKKIEMVQRMVQQYCNGVLTAAFDRYKDYMNLLKGLVGQPTSNLVSSTADSGSSSTNNDSSSENNEPAPEESSPEPQPEESSNDSGGNEQPADSGVDETGLYS